MSTLGATIPAAGEDFVAGDDLDVRRTVTGVPAGQTLTKAWLTFKTNRFDTDVNALLQKTITSAPTSSGQITDTGGSGTGVILFQLTNVETLALPIGIDTPYEIKVLTSASKVYTAEQGLYTSTRRITQAIS
jgi:hypothetical protein